VRTRENPDLFVNQSKCIASIAINYGYYAGEFPFKWKRETGRVEASKIHGYGVLFLLLRGFTFITGLVVIGNLLWLNYNKKLSKGNPIHVFHVVVGSTVVFAECCHGYNWAYSSETVSFVNALFGYFTNVEGIDIY